MGVEYSFGNFLAHVHAMHRACPQQLVQLAWPVGTDRIQSPFCKASVPGVSVQSHLLAGQWGGFLHDCAHWSC